MSTTFDISGRIFSTVDRFRNRFDPVNRSSTDIRRAVVNEKLKRSSSKLYRSTGDLLDDDDSNITKYPAISSDILGNMLSNRNGSENVSIPTSSLRPPSRQNYTRTSIPALIEISEMTEDEFVRRVIGSDAEQLQFQLGPSFIVYMAARFYLSPYYRNTLSVEQRKQRTRIFFIKIVERFRMVIKEYRLSKESLAFWLANSSELLNIMKQDRELSVVTAEESQQFLSEAVERTFDLLTATLKDQLGVTLTTFIDTRFSDKTACNETVVALDDTMKLLRRCRLNIALTIQLFSQLFHFINAYLFNWLVSPAGTVYCSTAFGVRLKTRLRAINEWAEKQGLEVAVECHMDRIQQAVTLLTTPKRMDQIANLGTTCYKLNSLQVRYLLEHVVLDVGEEPVSRELVDSVVRLAESLADVTAKQEGTNLQLEEQLVLPLPFLLPQDEYFIDQLRGIPQSITEYVATLQAQGLCGIIPQPNSNGSWKLYFNDDIPNDPLLSDGFENCSNPQMTKLRDNRSFCASEPYANMSLRSTSSSTVYDSPRMNKCQNVIYSEGRNPDIALVSLNRGTSSIGLSIVAAQGIGERCIGIYIKKVVEGSAAARDGRLQPGDQLLSVNGQSLVGISQEEAASKMAAAGPNITFEVNKQAARYNGLADWLNCPPSASSQISNYSNFEQAPVVPYGRIGSLFPHYNNHFYGRHQSSPSVAQTVPAGSGYTEKSEGQYGVSGMHTYKQIHNPPITSSQPDSNLRNSSRSMSATELYQNVGAGSLTNSLASLPPRGFGGTALSHLYNHSNVHGSSHTNIPSRYRTGLRDAIRPAVIQPLRPSASPRNVRRADTTSSQFCSSLPSTSESLSQAKNSSLSVDSLVDPISSNVNESRPGLDQSALNIQSDSLASSDSQKRKIAKVPVSKRDELNEELDKLELKGSFMTEADQRKYRHLVNELSKVREPLPFKNTTRQSSVGCPDEGFGNKTRLEQIDGSDKPPSNRQVGAGSECLAVLSVTKENDKNAEEIIGELQREMSGMTMEDTVDRTSNIGNVATSDYVKNSIKKKGVQWNEENLESSEDDSKRLLFKEVGESEPRTQVLGAQEVYRDPRLRRLNEIQARKIAAQPNIDGANLGFRDKMRLFAEQAGEKSLKNRYKTSSAQREIEQSLD